MTLHEAIQTVINMEDKPLSKTEVASIINSLSLFKREDGTPVHTNQIAARVNNKPNLFGLTEEGLIYVKKETQTSYHRLVSQLQDILRNHDSKNVYVIIATYIFFARVRSIYPEYINLNSNLDVANKIDFEQYQTGFELTVEDHALIKVLMRNISIESQVRINNVIEQYDFSISASSQEQFGIFFNELLNSSSLIKGALGDFATPSECQKSYLVL